MASCVVHIFLVILNGTIQQCIHYFHLVLNYYRCVFQVRLGCKLVISRGYIFGGLLRGILILYIFVTVYICQLWGNGVTIFGKKSFANKGTIADYSRLCLVLFYN